MIYRIDDLPKSKTNPFTGREYDDTWLILRLSDSEEYRYFVGNQNNSAYNIIISKIVHKKWKFAVGDFIGYCNANGLNGILVISQKEYDETQKAYIGRAFNEPELREYETSVLIHSAPMSAWKQIQRDGALKSFNKLKSEGSADEFAVGAMLGDPPEFSDYIMFGGGIAGEIVVNSKQRGKIIMDQDAEYLSGARLYFDAKKMARDGLLVRDGAHVKVKDELPLEPYLIWSAVWDKLDMESQISTPKTFAETADQQFSVVSHYNQLADEDNDPVHDPKPLRDYMDNWDGQDFIDKMRLDKEKSVLEIGVGTGRLATRVAPMCGEFRGIDISPKTVERAKRNLAEQKNAALICGNFLSYEFGRSFDAIYSSLTFMHIENKKKAINKAAALLNDSGLFVLSIDKNPSEFIDNGSRKIKIYPDSPETTAEYIKTSRLTVLEQFDTEFATVFVARKGKNNV